MVVKAISAWWTVAKECYFKATPDVFVGVPIMAYFYYKLSYGGKKAVKDKEPGHH